MANAFVQFKAAAAVATGNFATNPTTGNTIIGFVWWDDDASTLNSVTDTLGNTYTLLDNPTAMASRAMRAALFYAKNITGGGVNSVTANMSSGVTANITAQEWSGVDTASPVDQHVINNTQDFAGSGTDFVTSGNVTTSFSGEAIIGFGRGDSGTTLTAGTDFTQAGGGVIPGEYRTTNQAAAGSIAALFTSAGNEAWLTGIITLTAAGTGAIAPTAGAATLTGAASRLGTGLTPGTMIAGT